MATTLIHHRGEPMTALRQAVSTWAFEHCSADPRDVSLLVDELVSNALVHTQAATIAIHLDVEGQGTRIAVDDPSPVPPRQQDKVTEVDEHGRGLLMVGVLSSEWGWCSLAAGKRVWCRIR